MPEWETVDYGQQGAFITVYNDPGRVYLSAGTRKILGDPEWLRVQYQRDAGVVTAIRLEAAVEGLPGATKISADGRQFPGARLVNEGLHGHYRAEVDQNAAPRAVIVRVAEYLDNVDEDAAIEQEDDDVGHTEAS